MKDDGFQVAHNDLPMQFGIAPITYSMAFDGRLSDSAFRVMGWMLARYGVDGHMTLAEVVEEFGGDKTRKVLRELIRRNYITYTDDGFVLHDVALDRPVMLL